MQKAEEYIRLIIESAKDFAIFTLTPDRKINTWNSGAQTIFGYTEKEIVGKSGDMLFLPEDRAAGAPEQEAQKAHAEGRAENERWHARKDKSRFYGSGLTMPLVDDHGKAIGFVKIMRDLTRQKRAEEALQLSEERLRITMESATDYAIISMDTNGVVEGWSAGAERIFGYTAEEATGRLTHIIFTPEDIEANAPEQEMETARTEGRALDERWHIRADGTRFFMSGVMRPIFNPMLTGYVKVARDMTDIEESVEKLKISEERYRIALQSAEMAAWEWNIEENLVLWNDQHYALLGLEIPETEYSKSTELFMKFVHPADKEIVHEALNAAVQETGIYEVEAFRIVRTDGAVRWMSGYGRVVGRMGDRATRMVGVMYDITGRVESEQTLRDKQLKLELAQRAARVGIWGFDLETEKGIATPEWIELTGYPFPGDTWEMEVFTGLVHPEDLPGLVAAHKQAVSEKGQVKYEFRIIHPSKGTLWMLKRGQYIPPYGHVNASLMGSLIDITERKALEQQKEEFVGIASHELKTPVTSIKAYAEVLREVFEERNDLTSAELMQKLDAQVDRLANLIQLLLETSNISEGKLVLRKESFDLNALFEERLKELQRIAPRNTLRFDAGSIDPVHADKERIGQVLTNLVSNAIKYSPEGSDVVISTAAGKESVLVSVRDYGIGMTDEAKAQVFEKFFRATDAHASTFPGLGLGLYIAAEIVKRHSGIIGVESAPGKGSLFYFTIPVPAVGTAL